MADGEGRPKELKNTEYEIFIALVTMLAITNLVLVNVIDDPNLDTVLLAMNVLLSCILLGDFLYGC